MALRNRFKTVLVLICSGLSVYMGLLNLLDRMNWQIVSDGVRWIEKAHGIEIGPQKVNFRKNTIDLSRGDRLVSINGIRIKNLDNYTEVLEMLMKTLPPGTPATYLVEKSSVGEATVPIIIHSKSQMGSTDLLLGLVAFTHLGIGLFIFLRNWRAKNAFHFYLICLFAFVLYLYRYSGRADPFDVLVYWLSSIAFLVLPPLFLQFCCSFPKSIPLMRKFNPLKFLLYAPCALLLGLHVVWFSGKAQAFGLPRTESFQTFFDRLHLMHFIFLFLLGILALTHTGQRLPSQVQRLQMRWVTRGALAGLLTFICFYAIPFLIGLRIHPYMETTILATVLIPLSFGYAISKHRLMDVELFFKQGIAYILTSSVLLGTYVGIVLLIGQAAQGFSPESGVALFALSALLVALLFAPLRSRIQDQIDRYFYKEEFSYRQSLAEFGQTLGSEIRLAPLTEKITTRIRKTLNVDPVAIFLREDNRTETYHLSHAQDHSNNKNRPNSIVMPEAVFSDFDRELNPLFLVQPSKLIDQVKRNLADWQIQYVQPLRVHGRVIGFCGLGNRNSRELLSSEDLDLMGTLAGYAAIAIDNGLLYRSLETKARELAQLKAYSDNVVESITLGIAVVSPDGDITVWNNEMESLLALKRSDVVDKNISDIFPNNLLQTLRKVTEGPPWIIQETLQLHKTYVRSRDNRSHLVNITLSPFVSEDDVMRGILLVFHDITDKVRLENQLMQAEKLSSIGLLAAGIAHEVNTPLTGISSYAQMLIKQTANSDPRHELLKKIESQSFRASSIVNNLLNFSRINDSDSQEVKVNNLMVETLSLLQHQLNRSHINVELDLDPSLPGTLGNGGKLQQVLMNLFLNAKDAMPEGGHLRLKSYKEDSQLVIEIQDNGVGISQEDIKRIYDPFFTTKEVGKGTGLGLSVCYGIIQEHSGRISVVSQPGTGTTFRLQLPLKRLN